jgi:hypothetical protein
MEGADAGEDRPAHVRAGSGLAVLGNRLAVVQDDANFVALVDPVRGDVRVVPLPRGPDGLRQFDGQRGNKAGKLDLEACVTARLRDRDTLLAFGSGSSDAREFIAILEEGAARGTLAHAPSLYAALRAAHDFAGPELNVEGAVLVGDRLRLFQRGNGAARGSLAPVDATCDVDFGAVLALVSGASKEPPLLERIVQYDLGTASGVRLTFTDAALAPDGRLFYLAAAEDSPNAVDDGPVVGTALGVLENGRARFALLEAGDGAPFTEKAEGLAFFGGEAYVVLDPDSPARPSELCTVELRGPWA